MSEADESLWCWILNEYIQVQNRQEICRFVITSFKKRRIGTLGSFMPHLWNTEKCDDVIDVQNSCFAHKTSCLFAVTFSLTYQGTKKCDGVQNSCFLIKQIACLFVCFLTFSSRCTFARVVTMEPPYSAVPEMKVNGVQRVFSPNHEPDIPLISIIFFQSFEREYIQMFWKLM